MELVLATARSMQLRERGRVAEALAALLRNNTATEKLATARDRDRDGAGGRTALHFTFYSPQSRTHPPPTPPLNPLCLRCP